MLKSSFDVAALKKQLEAVKSYMSQARFTPLGSERSLLYSKAEKIVTDLLWDCLVLEPFESEVKNVR